MEEERTLYQKIVLVILAAMIVVFGIVTAFNQSRKGILFLPASIGGGAGSFCLAVRRGWILRRTTAFAGNALELKRQKPMPGWGIGFERTAHHAVSGEIH